jgi:hypothetical protein
MHEQQVAFKGKVLVCGSRRACAPLAEVKRLLKALPFHKCNTLNFPGL